METREPIQVDWEQIQKWLAKAAAAALGFALIRPIATSVAALSLLAVAITAGVVAGHRPEKPPPPNAWRIQQMTDAVREADARVRARMIENGMPHSSDPDAIEPLSGVFETMRDQTTPPELGQPNAANQSEHEP